MTRTRLLTTAVALVATVVVGWAPSAHAAAYRYWAFWDGTDGSWSFATAGPASLIPEDGAVQGWRFAVTTQAGTAAAQPRVPASFAEICGATPAEGGRKRVALVVDPGEPAQSPPGQQPGPATATCVVADLDATGYQVLRSVVGVRVERGLVCGVDGYPTGECAPVVDDPAPATGPAAVATPSPAPSAAAVGSATETAAPADDAGQGSPWALVGVLAAIAAVAGLFAWRRARA